MTGETSKSIRLAVTLAALLAVGILLSIVDAIRSREALESTAMLLAGQALNGWRRVQPLTIGLVAALWNRPIVLRFSVGLMVATLVLLLSGIPHSAYHLGASSAFLFTVWLSVGSSWRWIRQNRILVSQNSQNSQMKRMGLGSLLLLTAGFSLLLTIIHLVGLWRQGEFVPGSAVTSWEIVLQFAGDLSFTAFLHVPIAIAMLVVLCGSVGPVTIAAVVCLSATASVAFSMVAITIISAWPSSDLFWPMNALLWQLIAIDSGSMLMACSSALLLRMHGYRLGRLPDSFSASSAPPR